MAPCDSSCVRSSLGAAQKLGVFFFLKSRVRRLNCSHSEDWERTRGANVNAWTYEWRETRENRALGKDRRSSAADEATKYPRKKDNDDRLRSQEEGSDAVL
ncbi:hypothetical protein MRX96_017751 [Rhipicephalus microplus]